MSGDLTFGNDTGSDFNYAQSLDTGQLAQILAALEEEENLINAVANKQAAIAQSAGQKAMNTAKANSRRELAINRSAQIRGNLSPSLRL